MKAQELMLGSLVQLADDYYDVPKGTMFKVVEIYADTIFAQDIEGTYEGMELPEYKLEPIPITPEILEKNGFIRDDLRIKYFTESDDYYDSAIHEITDSIWCFEYQNCEAHFHPCCMLISHVHELQHALRLCGIEKQLTV